MRRGQDSEDVAGIHIPVNQIRRYIVASVSTQRRWIENLKVVCGEIAWQLVEEVFGEESPSGVVLDR
jgi:hypothetical protein